MHLLIGLGNPGKKYQNTRHNMGFLMVDALAKKLSITFTEKTSLESEIATSDTDLQHISSLSRKKVTSFILIKPQTFMNASGTAVKKVIQKFGIDPKNILVIYDDADIAFGAMRFRANGSSGGHNGMQSILDVFPKGTNIARLRIGIGRPPFPDQPLEDFVLKPFSKEEQTALKKITEEAVDYLEHYVTE